MVIGSGAMSQVRACGEVLEPYRQGGTLTGRWWRPAALAAGGAALLAGLLTWGPFPVDMIGVGGARRQHDPPSVALLAFAAAQAWPGVGLPAPLVRTFGPFAAGVLT